MATSLAAALKNHFSRAGKIDVVLTSSSGGRYEVYLDGKAIFSKRETGRKPSNDEIIGLVEEALRRR